jgi:hypothetical protein
MKFPFLYLKQVITFSMVAAWLVTGRHKPKFGFFGRDRALTRSCLDFGAVSVLAVFYFRLRI